MIDVASSGEVNKKSKVSVKLSIFEFELKFYLLER